MDSQPKNTPIEPILLEMKIGQNGIGMGIIRYSDQQQSRFFIVNGWILQTYANSPRISMLSVEKFTTDFRALCVQDFPGVGWLSSALYVGPQTLNDVDCYYFRMTSIPDVIWEGKVEAWIRVEDHYPARVRIEEEHRIMEYHYSAITPFAGDITLPLEFTIEMEKFRKRQEAFEIMRKINRKS